MELLQKGKLSAVCTFTHQCIVGDLRLKIVLYSVYFDLMSPYIK